jgi:hypothetical protein
MASVERHRRARILVAGWLAVAAACGDNPVSGPSLPPLSLAAPAQVEGRYTTCTACSDSPTVVVQFAVTVVDATGPGGTVATLDTRVINQSRGIEIARNVRPNGDVGLSASAVPAGGRVTVESGIGFPAPPPRDSLTVTVTVRMTDGREASASAPVVIVI